MERVFRSLKKEWIPIDGYLSLEKAKMDIRHYLMGYYNEQNPHSYNQGLTPAKAEEKPYLVSELVDHYTHDNQCCQADFQTRETGFNLRNQHWHSAQ